MVKDRTIIFRISQDEIDKLLAIQKHIGCNSTSLTLRLLIELEYQNNIEGRFTTLFKLLQKEVDKKHK